MIITTLTKVSGVAAIITTLGVAYTTLGGGWDKAHEDFLTHTAHERSELVNDIQYHHFRIAELGATNQDGSRDNQIQIHNNFKLVYCTQLQEDGSSHEWC